MVITCPKCKKGVISNSAVRCPTCGYTITANDFLKYIEVPRHRPFVNEGIAVGTGFVLLGIILVLAAIFGEDGGFSVGVFLVLLLCCFIAVVGFCVGFENLRKARSLYDQYRDKPEEYKIMLANIEYIKQINEAAKPTSQELEARRIKQEYLEAVESQQAGEPWRIRYATYPCPHCGHYKVRYANWEDKKLSVAFWGAMSDAIAKSYKCEYCRRMW